MKQNQQILVVDDEQLIRWSLEKNLLKHGFVVQTAESGEQALEIIAKDTPDLVLLDISMPGIDGLETLQEIKKSDPSIVVIMITALGVLETAVKAMQFGAFDYIHKPFNIDELLTVIDKALENRALKQEVEHLRRENKRNLGMGEIIASSWQMAQVMEVVKKVARSDAGTVLVQGESGTGKELIARALHDGSARMDKPFVAINCAAVPETLLESELMGHEKGAFTDAKIQKKGLFEMAHGGTVFLDEIGDMPPGMQAKLLRVLEERSFRRLGGSKDVCVDVRIVAATNKELLQGIEDGSFRKDLYYRIQVIPIYLPSLRERREDILPLAHFFVERFNQEFGKQIKGFTPEAQRYLQAYAWPGNIRELRNMVEREVILEDAEYLNLSTIPRSAEAQFSSSERSRYDFVLPPEGVDIEVVEKQLIEQALETCGHNQSRAARKLSLGIDAFRYRMKKFGLL
ncbi:MAG: sigma-54 dependent transcriptional regulator [Desulfuromonadaceae bacterium]|jgi:DNA-binding NtrC family response regulator|nr:sigma-54 dependent transcriptional regulator [Desulfuromonas sp.]MDY0184313.1 sigma-54 dependent transcriptional regulator [Desulfuromonadaceae bacterium]